MPDDAFARTLRERRRALDLTQADFARRVGCATITLKRIETGTLRPSRQLAERIVRLLELPVVEREDLVRRARILARADERNPYKGLRAFGEEDAANFFGREALVTRLVERLAAPARFLAVIGPSGSGKSSVVRAGLVPALRRSTMCDVVVFTPGAHPLAALELALQQAPRLLVIDQFEELWALCWDENARAEFLQRLLGLIGDAGGPRVVVTLRADFYDRPLRYHAFGALLRERTEVVLPLAPDEIARAVVGPAERAGVAVEPALVAACVADAEKRPGALPLLQYALTELFERRANGGLSLAGYRALGGIGGALTLRAEELYEALEDDERTLARHIFLRLVQPGENSETTRRRIAIVELPDNENAAHVVELFTRHRLLTMDRDDRGGTTVELAHEALIDDWRRLHEWIDTFRDELRAHRRLAQAGEEWRRAGRDASFLASGARLGQFEALDVVTHALAHSAIELNAVERDFLAASVAERERASAETLARQEALREALAQSEARRLAAEALKLLRENGNAELIALLALRSLDLRYTPQGDEALCAAARLNYPRRIYHYGGINLAISPDGRKVAIAGFETYARLFDIETGAELRVFEGVHTGRVYDVRFSPDGQLLATCSMDGRVQIWQVADATPLGPPIMQPSEVHRLSFSPNGQYLLMDCDDHTARLWDLSLRRELRSFSGHTSSLASVEFACDGQRIVTSAYDGTTRLWDVATGYEQLQHSEHIGGVWDATLSPDGLLAASCGADCTVRIWDASTGVELHCCHGHTEAVQRCIFSPDGALVASCGDDGTVRLWDVASGREIRRFVGHTAFCFALAFTPDGTHIITTSSDRTSRLWQIRPQPYLPSYFGTRAAFAQDGAMVATGSQDGYSRLWNRSSGELVHTFGYHTAEIMRIAFSNDGARLLTASADATGHVLDVASGCLCMVLHGHREHVRTLRSSPDDRLVVSVSDDHTTRLWDATTGLLVRELRGHTGQVFDAAFSPDGQQLVTGSVDGTIRLWHVASGEELRILPAGAASVAFSADGNTLFSGDWNGVISCWNVASGTQTGKLVGHLTTVWRIAVAPDGRHLLSASSDKTARLWDIAARRELRRFAGHSAGVFSVDLSRDGRHVLTAANDGTARLWDTNLEVTRRYVVGRLLRDFTPAERAQYGIEA